MNGTDSDSDDSAVVAFASLDFSGVNFDQAVNVDSEILAFERLLAFGRYAHDMDHNELSTLGSLLEAGQYAEILQSTIDDLFTNVPISDSVRTSIRDVVCLRGCSSVEDCVKLELTGIAALNLFLQSNYTGPSLEDNSLKAINPHACFVGHLQSASPEVTKYQNSVLSELAIDGGWPCQVCKHPYFLLLARSILSALSDPDGWSLGDAGEVPASFAENASQLQSVHLWNTRAVVAHERLIQSSEASPTLWKEAERMFVKSNSQYGNQSDSQAAVVWLERGLAEHHFDRPGKGKIWFTKAQSASGLDVEVTGVIGKRTKFQQKATAQMVVRATSSKNADSIPNEQSEAIKESMVKHSEDTILLEKIQFDDEKENEVHKLEVLDQAILLAQSLDVKNTNPADGLTGEQIGAFLARVLDHQDDWMVYSTALLERAWLEFERSHARERSILQMQALADQHTNRLTITQSTKKSIEESAPVQDRLRNLHIIVYPPRWSMIQDLADRYAALGIVTSAAELFTEIELWDSVVECYRRAGRVAQAEAIVRARLEKAETPRMWAALGDLTKDPSHYEKAIELSNGRFSDAYLALGQHYFDKGDLEAAASNFQKALKIRPLVPSAWFRLGTVSMQLGRWQEALRAFSEVVMQEPEEGDAWANIAAVHMHNRQSDEAFPALNEALKYQRSNWRIWVSKLYTCLDLEKFDEAIQACNTLLDLRNENGSSNGAPLLEEKCVRAIVGGTVEQFRACSDEVALNSRRRTLSRVHGLLNRMLTSSDYSQEPWVLETSTFLDEQTGQDSGKILESLMKEYRALQANLGWEKDDYLVKKLFQVVSHIVETSLKRKQGVEELTKAKFVCRGVISRLKQVRMDDEPPEVALLESLQNELESKIQGLVASS